MLSLNCEKLEFSMPCFVVLCRAMPHHHVLQQGALRERAESLEMGNEGRG